MAEECQWQMPLCPVSLCCHPSCGQREAEAPCCCICRSCAFMFFLSWDTLMYLYNTQQGTKHRVPHWCHQTSDSNQDSVFFKARFSSTHTHTVSRCCVFNPVLHRFYLHSLIRSTNGLYFVVESEETADLVGELQIYSYVFQGNMWVSS